MDLKIKSFLNYIDAEASFDMKKVVLMGLTY